MYYIARCVGLPNSPCPKNRYDWSVENGIGDLMLCPDCDHTRREQERRNTICVTNTVPDDANAAAASRVNNQPVRTQNQQLIHERDVSVSACSATGQSVDGWRISVRIAAGNHTKKVDGSSTDVTSTAFAPINSSRSAYTANRRNLRNVTSDCSDAAVADINVKTAATATEQIISSTTDKQQHCQHRIGQCNACL